MIRVFGINLHFRKIFGTRVQKIPLDAGFGCPNRDGTLSTGGCTFCTDIGSGSGMGISGHSLEEQWRIWQTRYNTISHFIAYLQSFSNTYGPVDKIARVVETLQKLPNLYGLNIGTRPDCVDKERLALFTSSGIQEIWLELGAQTMHNTSLDILNRHHTREATEEATHLAASLGLNVCLHLIAGLPGETKEHFLQSIEWVNSLPVAGVKFHGLYVCEHTDIARQWRMGLYKTITQDEYIDCIITALQQLRPDIVVHRLTSDADAEMLLAPEWISQKKAVRALIMEKMEKENLWQGMHYCRA